MCDHLDSIFFFYLPCVKSDRNKIVFFPFSYTIQSWNILFYANSAIYVDLHNKSLLLDCMRARYLLGNVQHE